MTRGLIHAVLRGRWLPALILICAVAGIGGPRTRLEPPTPWIETARLWEAPPVVRRPAVTNRGADEKLTAGTLPEVELTLPVLGPGQVYCISCELADHQEPGFWETPMGAAVAIFTSSAVSASIVEGSSYLFG